jgi:hypothetical protein
LALNSLILVQNAARYSNLWPADDGSNNGVWRDDQVFIGQQRSHRQIALGRKPSSFRVSD